MVLRGKSCDQEILNGAIELLRDLAYEQDAAGIQKKLKEIVPEYEYGQNNLTFKIQN